MGSNCPQFHSTWIEKNKRVIKMEFCHSSLAEVMKSRSKFNSNFSEFEILKLMLDIVPAVSDLHSINYVHLDIKPGRMP